jgi:uncharacterized protein
MHILLTGGTGFIGRILSRRLLDAGHQLTVYSRRPQHVAEICGPDAVGIDALTPHNIRKPLDAIINLAGEPIADRPWTQNRRQLLRDSRIGTTEALIQLCRELSSRPQCLISASAVGFYGDQGAQVVTEQTPPHEEFTHALCRDWEQAALAGEALGMRVCLVRTGLVIGRGGFLKRMRLPFKLGLGGRLGKGQQWMPWIHLDDIVAIYMFLLEHAQCSGPYNATAPNPVTNAEFTRTLGRVLKRPTPFPVPGWLLRTGLGEMSRLLLTGQRALPTRLQAETAYTFRYPTLESALQDVA